MENNIRRIGILTAGGDCPGLNAVIRAAAKTAMFQYGLEVIGVEDGFLGLIEKRVRVLSPGDVSGILAEGGTILGTSNKANPFKYFVNGECIDVSDDVLAYVRDLGLGALVCVGGDGTLSMAKRFHEKGLPLVGVPKTIDNDLNATDRTFGFDSAVSCVAEALDRIHSTAMSHHRIMVIETMGRYAGWIALHGGMAGGADVILIPEIPYEVEEVVKVCQERYRSGKKFTLIAIAEGAAPKGGTIAVQKVVKESTDPVRLGGAGYRLADDLEKITQMEVRVTVLGHLQRGGSPTAYDRNLGTRFGTEAVHLLMKGMFGRMVSLRGESIESVTLDEAVGQLRKVSCDDPLVRGGRALRISFGDCS